MRFAIAVGVLVLVTAAASAQQASLKPVATTGDVMAALVVPSSTAVFMAASEPPRDEKGWTALRAQALILAESGNLLMIGSRARDRNRWMAMSAAMRDAAQVSLKAIDARSATALADAGERVYETCEQCHLKYLPQAQAPQ